MLLSLSSSIALSQVSDERVYLALMDQTKVSGLMDS